MYSLSTVEVLERPQVQRLLSAAVADDVRVAGVAAATPMLILVLQNNV